MAMSGSRRSWAAMSAKRSSSACERRSSASSRLRAVMSWTTAEAPTTSPARSRSGDAVRTTSSSAAVLAHPLRLDALDALAGEDAAEARVLALEVLVAHEHAHVLADDLGARVAEQALRAGVPVRDAPLAVGADDRVVGGLDDRGHQLGGGLGAAQVGHVAVGDEDAVAQLHGAHLEHAGQVRAPPTRPSKSTSCCQGAPVSTTSR